MGIMSMSTVVGLVAATLTVAPAPAAESAWIVETAPGAVETVAAVAEDFGDEAVETFDDAFTGVAVELTDAEAGMLEQRADVVAVHPDVEMTLFDTQTSAPWHLSRLDQAAAPADGTYTYPASAGAGVRVYIVDSGIAPNAGQLGSRLLPGVSALAGDASTADCQGHGTHVAGIVASTTYGVAKKASVVPVRVFSCSGSTSSSTVISGLNWIAANHPAGTPGVVNMSLGGPASSPLDSAVQNLINRGMIVTVAAGNGGTDRIGDDACLDSPARVPAALTVGATTTTDARAAYSNFGTCLDLFAPGSAVRSLSYSNASSSVMMSGTSMAAPVVAGVAALAWGEAPGTSARQVESTVIAQSEGGRVINSGSGSTNLIVRSGPSLPGVQALTMSSREPTSLDAGWSAPDVSAAEALTYRIDVSSDGGRTWGMWSSGVSVTAVTLRNARPDTAYMLAVTPVSSAGAGARSIASARTLPAVPSAPSELRQGSVTATTIAVDWSAPGSIGASSLRGYSIEVSSDGGRTWGIHSALYEGESIVLRRARPSTEYLIRVRAVNAHGSSAASTVRAVTSSPVPGAVSGLVGRATSATSFTASWTAPLDQGGAAVRGYRLYISSDSGRTWSLYNWLHPMTSATVRNARAGHPYLFRVHAVNEFGPSYSRTVQIIAR